MATLIDSVDLLLREELAPGVKDALVKLDPLFQDVIDDRVSATRSDIGRDWKVIHTFVTSVAGTLRALNAVESDANVYGGGAGEVAYNYDTPTEFPGLSEFVSPGWMQKSVTLKSWLGNMFLPLVLMRADRLTASIGSMIEHTVRGTARMIAHVKSVNFFAPSGSRKAFATLPVSFTGGTNGDQYITFQPKTGRIRNFQVGMLVDILDSSNSYAVMNDGPLMVERVDPLTKTVRLTHIQKTGGSYNTFATASGVPGVDDPVVLRSSDNAGPTGLFDWTVASGTPFGINLTYFPQFKSLLKANLGQVLDDQSFRNLLGGFMEAYGDVDFDTVLCTQGVINGWISDSDDLRVFNPVMQTRRGSQAGFEFTYEGRTFNLRASALMPTGTLWAGKTKNNIKRYVPPMLPGAGSNSNFPGDIEFIAPLVGSKSIYLPALGAAAGITQFVQAPFLCVEEYLPEEMRGMLVGGITEQIDLGD